MCNYIIMPKNLNMYQRSPETPKLLQKHFDIVPAEREGERGREGGEGKRERGEGKRGRGEGERGREGGERKRRRGEGERGRGEGEMGRTTSSAMSYRVQLVAILTTVRTAPGFCTLRALTTWNTSTTPSVLHLSMVVAMAQNIPDLLTVSLQEKTHTLSIA